MDNKKSKKKRGIVMNDAAKLYDLWLEKTADNEEIHSELLAIKGSDEEILDRFYRNLEFGTAGLRGVLGAHAPLWAQDPDFHTNLVPLTVLIMFFSISYICLSSDASGLFRIVADQFAKIALKLPS